VSSTFVRKKATRTGLIALAAPPNCAPLPYRVTMVPWTSTSPEATTCSRGSTPGPDRLDFEAEWVDERPGRPLEDAWYYVRARQTDGHCAWLSRFRVDLP
jgi:hypothetical protein